MQTNNNNKNNKPPYNYHVSYYHPHHTLFMLSWLQIHYYTKQSERFILLCAVRVMAKLRSMAK
jgi:hypothetical protein